MPNSLPAPDPRSAIPGATRPTIISGMEKLRKLLKMELMVTKMRTPGVGRKVEKVKPRTIAMTIFSNSPTLKRRFIRRFLNLSVNINKFSQ